MIEKIDRIRNYDAFADFCWNKDVGALKRFNLVYGWNGSGKTSLSRVFKLLETGENPEGSDIRFTINGNSVLPKDFEIISLLQQVKVFNKDFIENSVFKDSSKIEPIFYISQDSKERVEEIEQLRSEYDKLNGEYELMNSSLKKASKELESFCSGKALLVKETLRSTGGDNIYNNFDRQKFLTRITLLLNDDKYLMNILDDAQLNYVKLQSQTISKPTIQQQLAPSIDYDEIENEANAILGKNVSLKILERLVDDPKVGQWVKEGFNSFLGSDNVCPFCLQTIPSEMMNGLKQHFNAEYNELALKVEKLSKQINSIINKLSVNEFPNKAEFYDHLSEFYEPARQEAFNYIQLLINFFKSIQDNLTSKLENPALSLAPIRCEYKKLASYIDTIRDLINEHNDHSNNLKDIVKQARDEVAMHYIAESVADYKLKKQNFDSISINKSRREIDLKAMKSKIDMIDAQLRGHRLPADELNAEIEVFFSRGDIKFQAYESGYKITRNGAQAVNLSDGEKSAIAILYFLKTLNSSDFDCRKCTVVIDDPVSSQDINNLYSTFAYLMNKVEMVEQVILLTHNYSFFKIVRNWASNRFSVSDRSYYQIECNTSGSGDTYLKDIVLNNLPSQLEKYDSEYHYLFSLIYNYTQQGLDGTNEQQLFLGNIARRVMETFLAFKYPQIKSLKTKFMKLVDCDQPTKIRVFTYINNLSHNAVIDEFEPAMLAETKKVMDDVMYLIKFYDIDHFNSFVEISTN